jgi:hypothetical protein
LPSYPSAANPSRREKHPNKYLKQWLLRHRLNRRRQPLPHAPFEWVGYTILENEDGRAIAEGDLNGDGSMDHAFLAVPGDTLSDAAESVHLIVLLHDQQNGVLKSYKSKDLGLSLLSYAGPESLALQKNVLSYFHKQMRNEVEVKFRYEPDEKDMLLIGLEAQFYGNAMDGPSHHSINYLTGKKISERTEWAREGEDLKSLPKEYSEVEVKVRRLSDMSLESIYDDL